MAFHGAFDSQLRTVELSQLKNLRSNQPLGTMGKCFRTDVLANMLQERPAAEWIMVETKKYHGEQKFICEHCLRGRRL